MINKLKILCVSLCLSAGMASAAAPAQADPSVWLQRMVQAPRSLNYEGTFSIEGLYYSGRVHITHVLEGATIRERLELLDGVKREIVRVNDSIQSFFPEDKVLLVDCAGQGGLEGKGLLFSAAIAGNNFGEVYEIRLGERSKLIGREVQLVHLVPRDDFRYLHDFWVDVETGVMLKARTMKSAKEELEGFVFSEFASGAKVNRERVKPVVTRTVDWRVQNMCGTEVKTTDLGWTFQGLPSGFRMASAVKKSLAADKPDALQLVLTDGLAHLSVFIEKTAQRNAAPTSRVGPTSLYRMVRGDAMITVLARLPMHTLKRVAESIVPSNAAQTAAIKP